jgi:hypothetical protein
MEILKEYPRSEREFIQWFWDKYSHRIAMSGSMITPTDMFNQAPLIHQCEAIWTFLGYPVTAPDEWSKKQSVEFTRNVLYIYESLLIKYPEGTPDTLRNLKEMSYSERISKYPHLEAARDIQHGLNEAIVEIEKYKIRIKPLPSLNEAIVMLKKMIMAPIVEDTFWTDLIPKKNEDAPF